MKSAALTHEHDFTFVVSQVRNVFRIKGERRHGEEVMLVTDADRRRGRLHERGHLRVHKYFVS